MILKETEDLLQHSSMNVLQVGVKAALAKLKFNPPLNTARHYSWYLDRSLVHLHRQY